MGKSIYVAEYYRISYGISALDRMLKKADVTLLHADPICIGKYLIVIGGDVEAVREASKIAEDSDQNILDGAYLLTGAHKSILDYFHKEKQGGSQNESKSPEAIGIFETTNAASGFISMDAALKSGQVELVKIWLGHFLGGKLCYIIQGSVSDVQAAIAAAEKAINLPKRGKMAGKEIIPYPDKALRDIILKYKP